MSGERVDWKLSWNTHDKWCIQNIGWLKYIGKDILSIEKWFAGTTCGHKFMFFYPRYPNIFWEDVLYFGGPHTLSAGVWMCIGLLVPSNFTCSLHVSFWKSCQHGDCCSMAASSGALGKTEESNWMIGMGEGIVKDELHIVYTYIYI